MESNIEFFVEMLKPLYITEDGDTTTGEAASSSDAILQSCGEDSALEKKEEHPGEGENNEAALSSETHSEELKLEKQQSNTEEEEHSEVDKLEDSEKRDDELNLDQNESEEQTQVGETEEENSSEQQPEGDKNQDEDAKKAHRLTPDFPDSLFELLCTLQEGRRLNDQRCSFRLEGGIRRRRCHSEPNTRKPANRVVFSSMTSLQKEEFFDLVATAQARRLDDQRAQLGGSLAPKPKCRSFRGSLKHLTLVKKPEPVPVPKDVPAPKDDLYDMILTTQAQGRLEDQRSRAPGPMDDEDFFSLLLKVQGGRMDEQRTELPRLLKT